MILVDLSFRPGIHIRFLACFSKHRKVSLGPSLRLSLKQRTSSNEVVLLNQNHLVRCGLSLGL